MTHPGRTFRGSHRLACVFAAIALSFTAAALAQDGSVLIEVQREEDIGLEGFVRPGTWAPMRLTIRNNKPSIRRVAVDWLAPDVDGDQVIARRYPVTLNPNDQQVVRLYGMPAFNSRPNEGWRVRVVDQESEELLAVARVAPPPNRVLSPRVGVIGLAGNAGYSGLERFRDATFQHETRQVISIVDLTLLPDRWYGMQLMDTLVWTSGARFLTAQGVPLTAIEDWVRRGGHLVISLTAADANWQDERLKGLLPPVRIGESKKVPVPAWLYHQDRKTDFTNLTISVRELTPLPGMKLREVAMLQPLKTETPPTVKPVTPEEPPPDLIAVHQFGFGRVTLIGLDISDPQLTKNPDYQLYGLPRLWRTVFGWRTPAHLNAKALAEEGRLVAEHLRDVVDLTSFISPRIAMKTKA
ncbi:MAG: hypothetical protein WD768_21735, partial [Phycisphaeraceae bacterium]